MNHGKKADFKKLVYLAFCPILTFLCLVSRELGG